MTKTSKTRKARKIRRCRNRKNSKRMHGGQLINSGNNTCVYNPPIECVDNSEIPPNHISRIVPSDSIEPVVQTNIKTALTKINPKYLKHFNLATKICKANFKQEDLTKKCTVEKLSDTIQFGNTNLINMLTPIQESDINRSDNNKLYKNLEITNAAIKDFLHAIVEMNSYSVQIFHTDAHLGNFSWKGDTIVLHDWEKCIIGDANLLINTNGSTKDSWRLFDYTIEGVKERRYLSEYPCWTQIIEEVGFTFDRFTHVFPPNHDTVHYAHEILFRFWDLFSIIIPIFQVYLMAKIKVPTFIKLIAENVRYYYYELFMYEKAHVGSANLTDRKTKLDEITNKIHDIIESAVADAAFTAADEKRAIDAELLKLVAKHANSSPSKQVLQNMLLAGAI